MNKVKKIIDTIKVMTQLMIFINEIIDNYKEDITEIINRIKEIWTENQEELKFLYNYMNQEALETRNDKNKEET